jgi:hypothetical protein
MKRISRKSPTKPRHLLAWLSFFLVAAAAPGGPPPSIPPEPSKVTIQGQELFALGFDKLSAFDYVVTDAGTGASEAEIAAARKKDQIPQWIHFYNEKRVVLTGFLLPLQMEKGLAKKLILMKDMNTCCFGATPRMNDYVVVTMKDGIEPTQDVPVSMTGTVHISEQYENGMVVSLFQFDGEKFLGVKK